MNSSSSKVWTIAEAKAKLPELLRLANDKPQYIGTKKPYVVVSAEHWEKINASAEPLGKWLIKNMEGVGELELPERAEEEIMKSRVIEISAEKWEEIESLMAEPAKVIPAVEELAPFLPVWEK